ncbi:MAG TPA: lysophospholipid acyltransferase family protein [bacterium]|nr:lysophospholipid acyltransferase family protein [bacterium]HPG46433.1 lysophospholipid acyltransferase family protein [bacterium]HPM98654.1 lysophospholipid acyltransferase family protein [bacterium]
MHQSGTLSKRFSPRVYHVWQKNSRCFLYLTRLRIETAMQLPGNGPAVLACNHLNWKDVFLLAGAIRRPISFAATEWLFDVEKCRQVLTAYFSSQSLPWPIGRILQKIIPPLSEFMIRRVAVSGAFPVRTSGNPFAMVEGAKEQLRQGHLVCIFPEGSIGRMRRLRRFKFGLAKTLYELWREDQMVVPVYPAAIQGTQAACHPGMKISLRISNPLTIASYVQKTEYRTLTALNLALRQRISQLFAALPILDVE